MDEVLSIPFSDLKPDRDAILSNQGVPLGAPVSEEIEEMCVRAISTLGEIAQPRGTISDISASDFEAVYNGEGNNESTTPVSDVYPSSKYLALFAVTLGEHICLEINRLFQTSDFAFGCMLDAAASVTADRAAAFLENHFALTLKHDGKLSASDAALRYSPGYCGWHISGQKKLFEFLEPERIGIKLRPSFLMEPLKSVSGVVLAGSRDIHEFVPSYPSCESCETYSCRDRISSLYAV